MDARLAEFAPARPPALLRYLVAVGTSGVALIVTLLLLPCVDQKGFSLFLAAVMASAWFGGLGPGLLATGLSVLASVYVLLPQRISPDFTLETGLRIAVFLFAAVLINALNEARRRSTAAAQADCERYAVILDSIGDAVIVTDSAGRITVMNPIAEALSGWPLHEARGRPISEVCRIVDEQTGLAVEDLVERAIQKGQVVTLADRTILIARDGVERPVGDSVAPGSPMNGRNTTCGWSEGSCGASLI